MQVGTFAFVGIKSDTIVINKGEVFSKMLVNMVFVLLQQRKKS